MKHPSAIAVSISLLFALSASIAAAKPDFSGVWKLDKNKSVLSGGMKENQATIEQTITIKLEGDRLAVTSKTTGGPLGEVLANDAYRLNGEAAEFTPRDRVGSRNAIGKRAAKWGPDGLGIEIKEEITREMQNGAVTVQNLHKWSLSADNKTLTIESTIHGPQGDIYTKRVFARQ